MTKNIPSSVLAALRSATHAQHVRINQHPLLSGLTGANYPLANYILVLTAYFHLFELLESRIVEFISKNNIPFHYESKLQWLKDDLQYFNVEPYHAKNLPVKKIEFPKIEKVGQVIGALYAIEGSTLGGQLISSKLRQYGNYTDSQGARFFHGYGAETQARWSTFCLFAEGIKQNHEEVTLAMTLSKLTFTIFEIVLDDYFRPNH